eukprot:m.97527 g.97527  ORF g.97527 m.97527 type:complete len:132 (+) comp13599_c0_seq2:329-724(+)
MRACCLLYLITPAITKATTTKTMTTITIVMVVLSSDSLLFASPFEVPLEVVVASDVAVLASAPTSRLKSNKFSKLCIITYAQIGSTVKREPGWTTTHQGSSRIVSICYTSSFLISAHDLKRWLAFSFTFHT